MTQAKRTAVPASRTSGAGLRLHSHKAAECYRTGSDECYQVSFHNCLFSLCCFICAPRAFREDDRMRARSVTFFLMRYL